MPIQEEKQANSLIVDTNQITAVEIQNRFGAKYEVIRDITPGRYLTILAVETDAAVSNDHYSMLENMLKSQFGVRAMQTVFGANVPVNANPMQQYNVYISGHLRIEEKPENKK
ncbi:MAG: hypothetical protein FWC50_00390 [Planctomycetaceae bacterium]|nr:hypothetical protein [Planctomycetaceae bacterium]